MKQRGFTLIELAIVVVIAGILAGVAIPIYHGIIEETKWSEGKTMAGTIKHALDVEKAKRSGAFPAAMLGAHQLDANFCNFVRLDLDSFIGSHFAPADFTITIGNVGPGPGGAGNYLVTVVPGNGADPPAGGTYTIDDASVAEFTP